jgi:hypothetical protein
VFFKGRSDIFGVLGPLRSLQNFSWSEWQLQFSRLANGQFPSWLLNGVCRP